MMGPEWPQQGDLYRGTVAAGTSGREQREWSREPHPNSESRLGGEEEECKSRQTCKMIRGTRSCPRTASVLILVNSQKRKVP